MTIWLAIPCVVSIVLFVTAWVIHRRSLQLNLVLARERDLLQTLLDNIPDQIYFKDAESRFIRVNQGVAKTLGQTSPDELIGNVDADYFTPEDSAAFRADDLKVMLSHQTLRDRVERGTVNGVETWMTTTKAPVFDRDGKAIGIVGISRDITDRMRAEQNLRELVSKARCILWNARVTFKDGKFDWRINFHSSDQLRKELGLLQEEWTKHIHPDQLKIMDTTSQKAMLHGDDGYNQEFWVTTSQGERRWINEDVRIARISDREWDLVGVALDITERKRFEQQLAAANDKLMRLASQDALTGLLNRRAILELAEGEWERWQRFGSPFSVLILDVDNFKRINDNFGHQAGDLALQHVAAQLQASIRKVDTVGRYGGEEFVIVLPETALDGAENVAEKVLARLRETAFESGKEPLRITVSIGAAVAHGDDRNIAGLLHRADCALLNAKRSGKDRLVSAVQPAFAA